MSTKTLGRETIQVGGMGQKLSKRVHDGREEVEQEIHPESLECVYPELCVDRMPGGVSAAWDMYGHWARCLLHTAP